MRKPHVRRGVQKTFSDEEGIKTPFDISVFHKGIKFDLNPLVKIVNKRTDSFSFSPPSIFNKRIYSYVPIGSVNWDLYLAICIHRYLIRQGSNKSIYFIRVNHSGYHFEKEKLLRLNVLILIFDCKFIANPPNSLYITGLIRAVLNF